MDRVRIVEENGSFALVECAGRWSVVELRDGHAHPVRSGERDGSGFPTTADGLAAAVEGRWTGEAEARRRLAGLAERGDELARDIW
ncbi:hypothetical protein [Arenibaculum sp.]|jgi:hypothetical protein|uniref:hypothetical protein n=1 Tax=Arenibaculum sp. TaxID=2865862 RepID=UPI002E164216